MNVFVIADPETHLAFALAGVKGRAVRSDGEVSEILKNFNREETGLVLITESLAEKHRETIDRMLLGPGGLLIVEIPDTRGPLHDKAHTLERIAALLRR